MESQQVKDKGNFLHIHTSITTMEESALISAITLADETQDSAMDVSMALERQRHLIANIGSETTSMEQLYQHIGGVMYNLSQNERTEVLEDLHGVATEHPEEAGEINTLLEELSSHLNSIKGGSAYEIAESQNHFYVTSWDFRLQFLRSQRYDPREAAKRIVDFFKMKQHLFGDDKLVQDITMSDLDSDEKEFVKSGTLQVAPVFDAVGRQVLVQFPQLRRYISTESELRARWYILMTLVKSQVTQKRGATSVTWMMGPKEEQQGDVPRLNAILEFNTLPIHWAAQHLCCEDFGTVTTASASIFLMPKKTVGGFRVHQGTAEECLSQLGSFGISKETIPLTPTSFEPQLIKHLNWYRHCQLLDSSSDALCCQDSSTDRAEVLVKHPKPNDVLFGHKRESTKNNGSKRLRSLTDQFSDEYERGHSVTKRQLIQRVVDEIQSSGGRFLRLIEGTEENARWEEVPIENVLTKIGQMFRNSRRYLAKKPSAADEVPAPRVVHEPDMRDVLLGRKAGNGGNRLVRELVVKLSPQYDAGTRKQKAELANAVFTEVKITGGRFLLQIHAEEWEEVSDDIARSKISKYFRNLRRQKDRIR